MKLLIKSSLVFLFLIIGFSNVSAEPIDYTTIFEYDGFDEGNVLVDEVTDLKYVYAIDFDEDLDMDLVYSPSFKQGPYKVLERLSSDSFDSPSDTSDHSEPIMNDVELTHLSGSMITFPEVAFHSNGVVPLETYDFQNDTTNDYVILDLESDVIMDEFGFLEGIGSDISMHFTLDEQDSGLALINGDNYMDIVVSVQSENAIYWYETDGSMNITEHVITTSANGVSSFILEDINDDTFIDIISTNETDDEVAFYLNDGTGTFTKNESLSFSVDAPSFIDISDMNNDFSDDLIISSYDNDTITIYELNNGTYSLLETITSNLSGITTFDIFDFNQDGFKDIVSANNESEEVVLHLNNGFIFYGVEPAIPVIEGYSFAGWYKDESYSEIFDFSNPINPTDNLYANMIKNTYRIFLTMDGDIIKTIYCPYDDLIDLSQYQEPTKEGYEFISWDNPYTNMPSHDITLIADMRDNVFPVITGITDGDSIDLYDEVVISYNEGTAVLNGESFESGSIIKEKGTYTLIVTDQANNETTISFEVTNYKKALILSSIGTSTTVIIGFTLTLTYFLTKTHKEEIEEENK